MTPPTTELYTLSLHDALPIYSPVARGGHRHISHHWDTGLAWPSDRHLGGLTHGDYRWDALGYRAHRSEEHTSELQSRGHLVCRLLLEKKNHNGQTSASNTSMI